MGVPERAENEKGAEDLLKERMIENFPNHRKEMIHNIPSTSSRPNIKRSSPRRVIIKLSKVKDRILKAAGEKPLVLPLAPPPPPPLFLLAPPLP